MKSIIKICPCGSDMPYAQCCEPYHQTSKKAWSAEVLMRSRYSAYVMGNEKYLLESWHQSTRPASLELKSESDTKWIGLKLLQTQKGLVSDSEGTVEFVARYKINGKAHKLHEVSRFVKEADCWYYVSGEHPD